MFLPLKDRAALQSLWGRFVGELPPAIRARDSFTELERFVNALNPRVGSPEHAQRLAENRDYRDKHVLFIASSPEIGGERFIIGWPELERITGLARKTLESRCSKGRGEFYWDIGWTFPVKLEKLARRATEQEIESYKPWVVKRGPCRKTELEFPQ